MIKKIILLSLTILFLNKAAAIEQLPYIGDFRWGNNNFTIEMNKYSFQEEKSLTGKFLDFHYIDEDYIRIKIENKNKKINFYLFEDINNEFPYYNKYPLNNITIYSFNNTTIHSFNSNILTFNYNKKIKNKDYKPFKSISPRNSSQYSSDKFLYDLYKKPKYVYATPKKNKFKLQLNNEFNSDLDYIKSSLHKKNTAVYVVGVIILTLIIIGITILLKIFKSIKRKKNFYKEKIVKVSDKIKKEYNYQKELREDKRTRVIIKDEMIRNIVKKSMDNKD